jgi:hypothetical protein
MNELETLQEHDIDHEKRIKKLEDSDVEMKIQLANIEKSQAEIKFMISENSKEQNKTLNDFTNKVLDTFTKNILDDNDTKNKVKFYNTKQFWAIAGSVITAIIGALIKIK